MVLISSIFEDGKLSLSKDNCSVASPGPLYNMVDDAHHVSSLFVPPASAAERRLIWNKGYRNILGKSYCQL